jgi:hypothetical protein
MTSGIRCGSCGSARTNWLADAVGCEDCGAATYPDGSLAHEPTTGPNAGTLGASENSPGHQDTAAPPKMTTTETVAADEETEDEEAADLDDLTVAELREQAAEQDIEGRSGMNKAELVKALGG